MDLRGYSPLRTRRRSYGFGGYPPPPLTDKIRKVVFDLAPYCRGTFRKCLPGGFVHLTLQRMSLTGPWTQTGNRWYALYSHFILDLKTKTRSKIMKNFWSKLTCRCSSTKNIRKFCPTYQHSALLLVVDVAVGRAVLTKLWVQIHWHWHC